MEKIFTIELDEKEKTIELHLNQAGAEYLKNILERLISNNKSEHLHLRACLGIFFQISS